MCCDATVCSAPGKDIDMPITRLMQCHITSISRCNSGNRNGLLVGRKGR
jgi:hypothetical protein